MSIDVHTDRTDLLVYKIHEAHTSILTCIPWVLFNLDAVQKSSIFQGCKMHEDAFSVQRALRTEKEAVSRKAGHSWRCLLANTNSDPYAAVNCLPENWQVFQMDFAHLHV